MNILVINSGSSSLKAKIFDQNLKEIFQFEATQIGSKKSAYTSSQNPGQQAKIKTHTQAIKLLKKLIKDYKIHRIGQRVVHGGPLFQNPTIINTKVKKQIKQLSEISPLHNPINLQTIQATEKHFPKIPQIAIFDTAFHSTIPKKAKIYPIPQPKNSKYPYQKYGFHGTNHHYVYKQAQKILKSKNISAISCHLGSGCSITAIKNGQSLEHSMGLTPLAGIPMATRSGDIDPGIVINMCQKYGSKKTNHILNKQSGLLALSNFSNHMLHIYQESKKDNQQAKLAIEHFAYQTAKTIASYSVITQIPDCIIFTGGIGENAFYLRTKIINHLKHFNLKLEQSKNRKNALQIHDKKSKSKILVIPANEEKEIASQILNTNL